jgi:hypothetical protein
MSALLLMLLLQVPTPVRSVTQGTGIDGGNAWAVSIVAASPLPVGFDGGYVSILNASLPVTGTFWQATQPISGTVTASVTGATLAAGTANIGDVDVLTLPSVTVGTFPDNEPFNVAQINGVAPLMGAGATGTGSLRVTVSTDSAGYGTANGAIPAQSQLTSARATAYGSSPTAVGAGNNAPLVTDLEGRLYVNSTHPRAFTCQFAAASTATLLELTGCAAVASNSYYITDISITGGTANAATVPSLLRSGTGSNCASNTVTLYTCWHGTAGSCESNRTTPIKATVAHALCLIDATVGTKAATVSGFIAP